MQDLFPLEKCCAFVSSSEVQWTLHRYVDQLMTGDVIINTKMSIVLELENKQQEEFKAAWHEVFYKPRNHIALSVPASQNMMTSSNGNIFRVTG